MIRTDTDWAAHVGHGPARPACLTALGHMRSGFARGLEGDPGDVAPTGPERGFVIEGLATGLTVADNHSAVEALLGSPDPIESSFAAIGRGVALALGATVDAEPGLFESDGIGFGHALIFSRRTLDLRAPLPVPDRWRDWGDHGVGRALWYLAGGDPDELASYTRAAVRVRRPWWWHGIATAAIMAPGPPPTALAAEARRQGVDLTGGVRLGVATIEALDAWTPARREAVAVLGG